MADLSAAPRIDVMVIAHNSIEKTIICLKTLYQYTRTPFHLIVVDDSTDLTPLFMNQWCKEHNNVTYIHSTTPYKTGNQIFNIALDHCKTPYMATVMNSIKVEPDWELGAIQMLESDAKVGYVGLKCLLPNGFIESAGIKMVKWLPTDIGRDRPSHHLSLTYEVEACQWAFGILRVEAGKGNIESEGFNGFRGWDDIDNCFCLKKAGWKIMYCGAGCGYHEPRATRGNDSKEAQQQNKENGLYFFKRWGFLEEYLKENPDAANIHNPPKGMAVKP